MKKIYKLLFLFIFIFALFLLVGCADLFRLDYGSNKGTPTSNGSTIKSSETKKSSVDEKTSTKTSKTSTKTSTKTTTETPTSKTTTNKPTTSSITPTSTGGGTPSPTSSTSGGGTPTSTSSSGQGGTPTSTSSSGSSATEKMKDSYKWGREEILKLTGITLPALEDIELKNESYFNDNNALFVIDGNPDIFTSFVDASKAVLTETPTIDTNTNTHWDLSELVGSKHYLGFLDISFVNVEICFEYEINEAYEVTVEASSGGSAILKDDKVAVTGNQGIYQEDYDKLSLEATPNDGYKFSGWYNGTTLLNTNNPYSYIVGNSNITITAKFELLPSMTESYSNGRNEFHEITGIWLPEITGVELLNSSSFDKDNHKSDFDIPYSSDALTSFIETVTSELEENIDFADEKNYKNVQENNAYFEFFVSSETRDYEAYVSIFEDNPTSNNPVLRTQYWIRYYYTIELVSDTGGTAVMKYNNNLVEGNKIALHESDHVSFIATPDSGYTIQGFYEDTTNLHLNNSSPYYISAKDVTITAKFKSSTNAVTQSYKEAQDLLLTHLGLHLEDAYDVETVNTDKTNTSDNYFSIIIYNATLDLFNTIFPSFKAEIEAKVKDKNDVITYYGDDFYHNYNNSNDHWWSFKVNDSDTAGDCQISFEYTDVKSRLSIVVTKPMTIDYMVARKRFYQVADILLPVYKGIEISDPYYDWSVERGFFSQGFKNTSTSYYNQVKALFDEKFPTSDITYITENVSCTWNTYRIVDNLGYFVYPHIIYSDYQGMNETSVSYSANPDYYSSGVVFFKELTGAELPIISGLECQYKITANSVTFEVFKDEGNLESSVSTSYKSALGSMSGYTESGPTSSSGYTVYTYTNGSKVLTLKYKSDRVIVESNFVNDIDLYARERKLVGDYLPDKENITVTEFAYKQQPSYDAGAKIIMTGENLTYDDYLAIENKYASSYNKDGEASGNEASGRTAKFKYAVTKYKVVWIPATSTTTPIIKVIWDYHETNVENL